MSHYQDVDPDVITQGLEEGAKLTSEVACGLRHAGDRTGIRAAGPAYRSEQRVVRNAEFVEPGLVDVPGPVARRLRVPAGARHRRTKENLPAEAGVGRVDRHHVPDRAALRHRPGHAAL